MLARTMQDVSYLPPAIVDPTATLPWHEQDDIFVSYEEEEAMLSSAFGFQVRITRPPSPSDPSAYERWITRLRNDIGPIEQLEEDDVDEEHLDEGRQRDGDIMGLDAIEFQMESAPEQAIFMDIPFEGGITA